MNKPISYFILFTFICLGWAACSPTSKGPIAKAYQNTTARYNAYFLGNERLKVIQTDIYAKSLPDYNRLLPIFPTVDSTMAAGFKKDLDEVIKKASYPIQKHPTSDWTDDSYLLIGKARFIGLEYDDAIKTFKYVNSTSKTEETKHEALLWLMRSFIYNNELESAKAVSDIMKKQFLNKENATLLFLTRAQYYLLLSDTKLAIENLKLAVPLIEKKDEEARIRFILGQLYQETNQDKLAYQQFTKILRKTPPYELGFQSKLHLGQVTEIANANDKERIDKYFRKLQKDTKNKEYLDKVYYEMARFELKQNKPTDALALLNQSVKASKANVSQKGYSYLLAGQIYYDKLLKYPLAQAYYDSAVQVLPKNATEYMAAAERRDVLNEFITQLNIIQRQDSLLALSNLDKTALDARITEIITQTQEKKALEERKLAAAANQPAATGNNAPSSIVRNATGTNTTGAPTANAAGLWYFDNPVTISTARSEFIRNWGNRKLQDNWRISSQAGTQTITDDTSAPTATTGPTEADMAAQSQAMRTTLLSDIPVTTEKKTASSKQIEDGLFALGGIYRLRLNEPTRAVETYEKLITRFPKSKYLPEVYYTLFLMFKASNDPKQATYAGLLKQQFPNTRYAKLIDDPDYLVRISERDKLVRALYDSAFTLYQDQKYPEATNVLNNIRKEYSDTEIMDKIAFLNVMIIGQTEQPTIFKLGLQQFITQYPASPLADKARMFQASIALYESGKLSEAEFDKTHPGQAANNTEAIIPEPISPASNPIKNNTPTNKPPTIPAKSITGKPETTQTRPPAITPSPAPENSIIPPPSFPTVDTGGPKYVVNLAMPHMVMVAYPKGHAAFTDVITKIQGYNEKYNAGDKLTVEIMALGLELEVALVRGFIDGNKAKAYAIKQKSPQSPLSKIRGIKFDTFVISTENLPVLLKGSDVAEYLTFYKNNY